MIPKLFGFPLWTGKMKARVAKKYLQPSFKDHNYLKQFNNLGIGSLVYDCSGYNVKIVELEPEYVTLRGNNRILYDIQFTNTIGGTCSLIHCGVCPAKDVEEIRKYKQSMLEYYSTHHDEWGFAERIRNTVLNADGTANYK